MLHRYSDLAELCVSWSYDPSEKDSNICFCATKTLAGALKRRPGPWLEAGCSAVGRPKKQPADRRTVSLSCRLTSAERLTLEHAAMRAGMSASDYVRKLVLSGKVIVRENRRLDHASFDQLRRIGVNLNQLTRVANRTGNVPDEITQAVLAVERFIARELASGADSARRVMPDESDGS